MKLKTILGVFVVCCTCLSVQAQQQFRVMEYNVENLFDCRHDSLKMIKNFCRKVLKAGVTIVIRIS